jgi:hypothetical protein
MAFSVATRLWQPPNRFMTANALLEQTVVAALLATAAT